MCFGGTPCQYDEVLYDKQIASQTEHAIVTEGDFPSGELSEVCENGHLFCQECHEKLWADPDLQKKCPMCRQPALNPHGFRSRKIKVFSHGEAVKLGADSDSAAARMIERDRIKAENWERGRSSREEREKKRLAALEAQRRYNALELRKVERKTKEANRVAALGIKVIRKSINGRIIVCVFRNISCDRCQVKSELGITFHCQEREDFNLCSKCMLQPTEEDRAHTYTPRESPELYDESADEETKLAFAMGMHSRLGADSNVPGFDDDVMRIITRNSQLPDYNIPRMMYGIDQNSFNYFSINSHLYMWIREAGHSDAEILAQMPYNNHLVCEATKSMNGLRYVKPGDIVYRVETSVWTTMENIDGADLLGVGTFKTNDDAAAVEMETSLCPSDLASSANTPIHTSVGEKSPIKKGGPPSACKQLTSFPDKNSMSDSSLDPQKIADLLYKYGAQHSNAFAVYENIGLTRGIRCALVAYIDSMRGKTGDDKIDVDRSQIVSILTSAAGHEECSHFMDNIEGIFPSSDFKIILRRTESDGTPRCIAFHKDDTLHTMAIPLNAPGEQCTGGQLVYLNEAGPIYIARETDTLTLHDDTILHGISAHTSGVRFGMYLITPLLPPTIGTSMYTTQNV